MHRLFVALRPPEDVRDLLSDAMTGVPDARWQDDAQLHLTLRFIGEVDGHQADDVATTLGRIAFAPPDLRVAGVGSFASGGIATSLWASIAPAEPLAALHAKIDRALVAAGVAPDRRAYVPHITLARLSRTTGRHPAVGAWLARNAGLMSGPFAAGALILYESTLDRGGARYDAVAAWPPAFSAR